MRRRGTTNLDDIRRSLRLGMGPCQGGFCIYRATGILHAVDRLDGEQAAASLRGFLQERWKGVWPILYGDQLRQARLDDWIFQGLLDVEHLPGDGSCPTTSSARAATVDGRREAERVSHHDVIVVGTGLAGLTAAVRLAESGARVLVLAKGVGATHLSARHDRRARLRARARGAPGRGARRAARRAAGASLRARRRRRASARRSTGSERASPTGRSRPTPTPGGLEENLLLPTRGRRAAPVRGRAGDDGRAATCATARRSASSASARSRTSTRRCSPTTSSAGRGRRRRARSSSTSCPRAAPTSTRSASRAPSTTRRSAARSWRRSPRAGSARRSASPSPPCSASPTRTPSGRRSSTASAGASSRCRRCRRRCRGCALFAILRDALRRAGGSVLLNNVVVGAEREGARVSALRVRVGLREELRGADWVVLATGGFASGGLELDSRWAARETALGLPVRGVPAAGEERFRPATSTSSRSRAPASRSTTSCARSTRRRAGARERPRRRRDARRRRAVEGEVRRRAQPGDRPPRGRAGAGRDATTAAPAAAARS